MLKLVLYNSEDYITYCDHLFVSLADMTAEELFNMFFGSGFSSHHSNVFMRRNGRWHHANEDDNANQVIFSSSSSI